MLGSGSETGIFFRDQQAKRILPLRQMPEHRRDKSHTPLKEEVKRIGGGTRQDQRDSSLVLGFRFTHDQLGGARRRHPMDRSGVVSRLVKTEVIQFRSVPPPRKRLALSLAHKFIDEAQRKRFNRRPD